MKILNDKLLYLEFYFSGTEYFDSFEYNIYDKESITDFISSGILPNISSSILEEDYFQINLEASDIKTKNFDYYKTFGIEYSDFSQLMLLFGNFSLRLETHNVIENYFQLFLADSLEKVPNYKNIIIWNEDDQNRIKSTLQIRGLDNSFFKKFNNLKHLISPYHKNILDINELHSINPFAPYNIIKFMGQVFWTYESASKADYEKAKNVF